MTVAGVTYTIASPSVAYQLSSLSGGGVGQVVSLLLGMNDAAVSVLTGDAADAVFYGVVQSSSTPSIGGISVGAGMYSTIASRSFCTPLFL